MRQSILKAVFGGAFALSCMFSGAGCGDDSSDSASFTEAALRGGSKASDGGVAKAEDKCRCKGSKRAEKGADAATTHGNSDAKGANDEGPDVDEEADESEESEESEDSEDLDLQPLKKTSDGGVGKGKDGKPDDSTSNECVCQDSDGGTSAGKSHGKSGKGGKKKSHGGPLADAGG